MRTFGKALLPRAAKLTDWGARLRADFGTNSQALAYPCAPSE
jgi:hypothetical protein